MFTLKFFRTDTFETDGNVQSNREFTHITCHNFKCTEISDTGNYVITAYREPLMMLQGDGIEYRIDSNQDYFCYDGCQVMNSSGKTVDQYFARVTLGGKQEEVKENGGDDEQETEE